MANLYTIEAGIPFARALASGILQRYGDDPQSLARIIIFLPTNRACQILQEAFTDLSNGKAMLLPKLKTIGNIDEEDLSLTIAGHDGIQSMLDIPPAIDPLKRQILLARLIRNIPGRGDNIAQAMQLAAELARLMDQIHTEGLSLSNLKTLVPDKFSEHWQITLNFFQILEEHWPKILQEHGAIDPAARRDRLIRALTAHWTNHPPQTPIIAAGSTGSIPATAEFLNCIAHLPNGAVILPGADLAMPPEEWEIIEPHHPQYGLKHTIQRLGSDLQAIKPWPSTAPVTDQPTITSRQTLARAIMAPDPMTANWSKIPDDPGAAAAIKQSLRGITLHETPTEQEEATIIALHLRALLADPDTTKTGLLITPDRNLARRVSAICKRWDINIDDSSGMPLSKTPTGIMMQLILEYWQNTYDPVRLLALLKNPLCTLGWVREEKDAALQQLETIILRSSEKTTLKQFIHSFKSAPRQDATKAISLLEALDPLFDLKAGSNKTELFNINSLIKKHIHIYNSLSGHTDTKTTLTSTNDSAREAAINTLENLSLHAVLFDNMNLNDYQNIFTIALNSQTIRPPYGGHPRLKILGQIEARTLTADLVIMAGLNEDMWPAASIIDPWMSQSMRADFGLSVSDQYISLAAHDFVQGLCNSQTIITRSQITAGSPTIPSRWIQRLKALIEASKTTYINAKSITYQNYATALNTKTQSLSILRPAPTPPLSARPTKLSVTQIETWLKDPYSIYARHILKLKKLRALNDDNEAATRGTIIHDTMEKLLKTYPHKIPASAQNDMLNWAHDAYQKQVNDPAPWSFWAPQLETVFSDTLKSEINWRETYKSLIIEEKGGIDIQTSTKPFTLTARVDRIDIRHNDPSDPLHKTAAIIDYKTGGQFTKTKFKSGQYPQLPLQALILAGGGFQNAPPLETGYLGYWYITASSKGGEKIELAGQEVSDVLAETKEKLSTLIATYAQENTAYLSLPRPEHIPRYNDYLHLSRAQEWSSNESEEQGEID